MHAHARGELRWCRRHPARADPRGRVGSAAGFCRVPPGPHPPTREEREGSPMGEVRADSPAASANLCGALHPFAPRGIVRANDDAKRVQVGRLALKCSRVTGRWGLSRWYCLCRAGVLKRSWRVGRRTRRFGFARSWAATWKRASTVTRTFSASSAFRSGNTTRRLGGVEGLAAGHDVSAVARSSATEREHVRGTIRKKVASIRGLLRQVSARDRAARKSGRRFQLPRFRARSGSLVDDAAVAAVIWLLRTRPGKESGREQREPLRDSPRLARRILVRQSSRMDLPCSYALRRFSA